tara:strand:- start:166 stop:357 length:192 start_codon:yes stop_codon:yes gene_type:complete
MNKKIINVNGEGYMILGTVSVETGYSADQLKLMWRLADAVLKNENEFYICSKIIEAEFVEKSA